jgi:hypothetical protein
MTRTASRPARASRPDAIAMLAALTEPQANARLQDQPVAPPVTPATNPRSETKPALLAERPRPPRQRKPKTGARAGTRHIGGHFPDATLKALKHLMAEEDCTLQALLDEAITDLLVKKGMSKLLAA